MNRIQIKDRCGDILYENECENNTIKVILEKAVQEFITNHLSVVDFGYLILPSDDRLNDEALSNIRRKFKSFLEGESDG